MNIQIAQNVLEDARWHPLLDVVADLLSQPDSRHSFDVSEYPSLLRSPWLSGATGLRANTAELIRAATRRTSRDGLSTAVTVRLDVFAPFEGTADAATRTIRIHPRGALVVLMQPLHIIVEDEVSDGAFLLWMARALGRDAIIRSYRAGRLLFRHAGGKGQVEKSAKALTSGVWPREGRPILSLQQRAVVVLDSDSKYPGHQPNKQYVDGAIPHAAFVHVLAGRTIESYVPKSFALKVDGLNTDHVEAFFRMNEVQRMHFPIKRGFCDNGLPPRPLAHETFLASNDYEMAERNLYRQVDASDWKRFVSGFGSAFAVVYQEKDYRCQPGSAMKLLTNWQQRELNDLFTKLIVYL